MPLRDDSGMEDDVQRRGSCAMRPEHTHCVLHPAARRQQRGDMVSGSQLVIHNNTENPQVSRLMSGHGGGGGAQ